MDTNNDKKPIQIFRSEIKWTIFIVLFVASVLFNYFTTMKQIILNTYRIEQVEMAREKAWAKYDINCEKQTKCLEDLRIDINKIKIKLGIED